MPSELQFVGDAVAPGEPRPQRLRGPADDGSAGQADGAPSIGDEAVADRAGPAEDEALPEHRRGGRGRHLEVLAAEAAQHVGVVDAESPSSSAATGRTWAAGASAHLRARSRSSSRLCERAAATWDAGVGGADASPGAHVGTDRVVDAHDVGQHVAGVHVSHRVRPDSNSVSVRPLSVSTKAARSARNAASPGNETMPDSLSSSRRSCPRLGRRAPARAGARRSA